MESTVANTRSSSQRFGPRGTALSNTSGISCFRSRLVVLASFINPVHGLTNGYVKDFPGLTANYYASTRRAQ